MSESQPPVSSREATMRILLGDMMELLDKSDAAAATMREAHDLIDRDLESLGGLVTRVETALTEYAQDAEQLVHQLRKIKDDPGQLLPPAPVVASPTIPWVKILALCFACSLLSAGVALGVVSILAKPTLDQARIGKAVTNALPHIDQSTRQKLEAAIQKTGS